MHKYTVALLLCLLLVCASAFAAKPTVKRSPSEVETLEFAMPEVGRSENPAAPLAAKDVAEDEVRDVTIEDEVSAEWGSWFKHIKKDARAAKNWAIAATILCIVIIGILVASIFIFMLYWCVFSGQTTPNLPKKPKV